MANPTPVDRLYGEASAIARALEEKGEVSLQVAASDSLRKSLLLAAASHFEQCLCEVVLEFVRERAGGSVVVAEFVRNKAVSRQYHTWFNWDESNANHFFGLFGPIFRSSMIARVKTSDLLRDSIRAFLEIGNDRNRLIHQDYATFPLEKTMEEIYGLYQKAHLFVDTLGQTLRESDMDGK